MATNFYFNNFKNSQEQDLLESLIIEAIRIYGQDMYYIPRNFGRFDQLRMADDQSYYDKVFQIEMYIKSVDGFGGDGSFMSKFGLEIRDQVVFSVSQKVFNQEITNFTTITRPREGDLIYFPLNNKCFQIKYTNKFEMFYQLGALQTWEMTCELFEYSSEDFDTGIPEIDALQSNYSTNILDWTLATEDGFYLTDENGDFLVLEYYDLDQMLPGVMNNSLEQGTENYMTGSDGFVDFSQVDPFSEGNI